MTKKPKHFICYLAIILLIIFSSIYIVIKYSFVRTYSSAEPKFETGMKWHSTNPKIDLVATKNGTVNGIMFVNEKQIDFIFGTREGTAYFLIEYDSSDFDESLIEISHNIWATGNYKIMKNGNIVIKNLEGENPEINYSEIILKTGTERRMKTGD